jgi:hypothetical protein
MLVSAVDDLMGELVGDAAYFHEQEHSNRA